MVNFPNNLILKCLCCNVYDPANPFHHLNQKFSSFVDNSIYDSNGFSLLAS